MAPTAIRDTLQSWMHAGRRRHTVCSLLDDNTTTTVGETERGPNEMFGKKKVEPPYPSTVGEQENNTARSYTAPTHEGHALPGQAGFNTYKLRGKNAMPDLRFTYVRPDGKPDRGQSRYAK